MSRFPKISVVTPSYNQGRFLGETIESVLGQTYPNLEYIIIDGGSTDGSVEIIRKYEKHIAYWTSEPDRGQSDALNKGFSVARGDYFVWINSDDIILPGILNAVGNVLMQNPATQWVSGNTVWIDENSRIINCGRLLGYSRFFLQAGFLAVGGPSTFFSRSLYKKVGGFKEELFFTMDTDMWWRFIKNGAVFEHIAQYLMAFRFHAQSKCSAASFSFDDEQKMQEVLTRKIKKENESSLLSERYGNSHLLPYARACYRARQLLNGNYFRAWLDMNKMRGKKWTDVFPTTE